MATPKHDSSPEFSAEVVGNAFVSQYYNILHQSPEFVHKFYQDTSTMSRPRPDGSLTTVTTMEGIKDLVASLACHDYRAEIMTADAQGSFKDGVIVLVTGRLTTKDNIWRMFSETFFLAPQDNGYYVHNDVFRFIDEARVPGVNSLESKDFMHSTSSATLTPEPEATEVHDKSLPKNTVDVEAFSNGNPEAEELSNEISAVKESFIASEPPAEVVNQKDDQSVPALASEVSEDAPKKSYASIVKVMKENKDAVPVHVPSKTTRTSVPTDGQLPHGTNVSAAVEQPNGSLVSPGGQRSAEAVAPNTASESSVPNGNSVNGNGTTDQAEDKGYSIYIGNLPYNASVGLVENEFKKFGPIKRGGIQVRCNKGFCFGFVEFESLDSMQKAIQTSKLHIGGNDTFIEEKKTSTRVVNGVISFAPGGGRGGYRNNNGFRGRGNFSSGGRGGYGGRNDYGRRGGDHYPNGARNGDGGGYLRDRVYQNGGGRRASQQVSGGK